MLSALVLLGRQFWGAQSATQSYACSHDKAFLHHNHTEILLRPSGGGELTVNQCAPCSCTTPCPDFTVWQKRATSIPEGTELGGCSLSLCLSLLTDP